MVILDILAGQIQAENLKKKAIRKALFRLNCLNENETEWAVPVRRRSPTCSGLPFLMVIGEAASPGFGYFPTR